MCKAPMEKGKKSVKNAQSKSLLVSQSRSITVTEPPEDAGARPLARGWTGVQICKKNIQKWHLVIKFWRI